MREYNRCHIISSRLRTAAYATLNAIRFFLLKACPFLGRYIYLKSVSSGDINPVSIDSEKDEYLLGSAMIKQDTYEAVVAAVLSAINRRISLLIKE